MLKRLVLSIFICVMGIALVFASGCSRTQMAYNHFDWFLLKRIDHYFTLTSPQETYLEQKITVLHTWHRQRELPMLVDALRELRVRFQDGLSREDIDWIDETQSGFWRRFVEHGLPDFARFLDTVQPEQVDHLRQSMVDRNDFLVQQTQMTDKELKTDILEWLYGLLENWYGELTEDQRQKIAEWVQPDAEWIGIRLAHRNAFQKDFAQLLKTQPQQGAIYRWLMERVIQPEIRWNPDFKQRLDAKWKEWKDIFYRADALMQPHQRQHALDRLEDYLKDFEDLMQEA